MRKRGREKERQQETASSNFPSKKLTGIDLLAAKMASECYWTLVQQLWFLNLAKKEFRAKELKF